MISAESLPPDTQPGTVLTTEDGIPFVVIEISGPVASVDFNHPLAGKHLIIDVRILSVEAPDEPHGRRLGGLEAQQEFSI